VIRSAALVGLGARQLQNAIPVAPAIAATQQEGARVACLHRSA
jgi:hypothetical protein